MYGTLPMVGEEISYSVIENECMRDNRGLVKMMFLGVQLGTKVGIC